jgi:hypothetical protein
MKTISELTDFYYNILYPSLQELEKDREDVKKRFYTYSAIYTASVIALFIIVQSIEQISFNTLVFLAVILPAGLSLIYKWVIKDYRVDFKNKIIAPLIKEIDPSLNYLPTLHIPISDFNHSNFFQRPDKVSGNDFVKGKIDGVELKFSDFHAQKVHKDSKGRESYETIFQGLFIISEFPKNFRGETLVLPDSAQKMFGNLIGNWLQSKNFSRDELVKMDNIEFEKEFVVYATDQVEARYILTPSLMEKLLIYKKRTKHPLYISFKGGKIYMAIEYNDDMFEPSVFHSLLEYKIAKEYIETLHLAVGVVEELKLNQKLWRTL